MAEKPLNVQVAEALGCKPKQRPDGIWLCSCSLREHEMTEAHIPGRLADFPTDWAATGPLIEKHRIQVGPPMWMTTESFEIHEDDGWMAMSARITPAKGPTPLVAVCNLILKLAEEKKLGINAST